LARSPIYLNDLFSEDKMSKETAFNSFETTKWESLESVAGVTRQIKM